MTSSSSDIFSSGSGGCDQLHEPVKHVLPLLREETAERLSAMKLDTQGVDTRDLAHVALVSRFVCDALERDGTLLSRLVERNELSHAPSKEDLLQLLQEQCAQCVDEEALGARLRCLRREWMVGIIWRDLCREHSDVDSAWDTARAVTLLAEAMLQTAIDWLQSHYAERWGRALHENDTPMSLVVLGMGKFGAEELNLSSDIDLIFAYAQDGNTQGGRRSLSHQEYFTRIGQRLIRALDAPMADGFVFRIDMRLRPLGDGGPLVGSFASLDRYYQDQGREWERFAMLKARPVAGDTEAGHDLLERLKPFIYRRYVDFGAIQSLRDMKAMINREVRRRGLTDNIKLGAGGIREVEFVVQVFQLIRGGRDTELQTPSLRKAMEQLLHLELLPPRSVQQLEKDYLLLRDCEHVLQAINDTQTQDLPTTAPDRARVAYALSRTAWPVLVEEISALRVRVHEAFESIISSDEDDEEQGSDDDQLDEWRALWLGRLDQEEMVTLLSEKGFVDSERVGQRIKALRNSRNARAMQRIGHERLDALMPLLLQSIANEHHQVADHGDEVSSQAIKPTSLRRHYMDQPPDVALERVLALIEAVLRRTAYLSLLRENESARTHLVRLCAASPWIAEELTRHPMLLDELLTPAVLYTPQDRESLTSALDLALLRIPEEDEEAQLEALRGFKHAQVLAVAASDLAGARALMKVSDALTLIAEVILERVVSIAWKRLVARYGEPQGEGDHRVGFIVVGYGKLGGLELGYGSDLDLVFIHNAPGKGTTSGPRSLDNGSFFARLGQRIIHLLTAVTPSGILYEVDMRLRPSGNAGLLVSSLDAFAEYQRQQAWTWEHQALVRARVVTGDDALGKDFEALRSDVLKQPRDPVMLRKEVVGMRHKMRDHLGSSSAHPELFDIKQDSGGMIDIEFIDQYAVLAFAARNPDLATYSDNVRILEILERDGPWPSENIRALREAYLAYRDVSHINALAKRSGPVPGTQFVAERACVTECWQAWMEPEEPETSV